jgi:hypothetical protein
MGTLAEAVAVGDELEQSTRKESARHSVVDHQHHDEDLSAKDETALTVNERRKKNLSVFVTEPGIFSTLDLFISHVYMSILGRLGSGAFAFAFTIVQLPQLSLHIIYSFDKYNIGIVLLLGWKYYICRYVSHYLTVNLPGMDWR